jgi:fatty-acyl-CoA synthase
MTRFDEKLAATIAHARRHTLGDLVRRTASRAPDKTALIYRDLRQSYAGLDATINRTANALAQRGVVKGERIALLSHNNHAYVVTCLALARLGAITVPVNFVLGASEVAFILEHAGATGLIAEDALVPVADEAIKTAPVDPMKGARSNRWHRRPAERLGAVHGVVRTPGRDGSGHIDRR